MNRRTASVNKYNKENTSATLLRFNKKTDADIIEILDQLENKQGYIKDLIRSDMSGSQLYFDWLKWEILKKPVDNISI